MGCKRKIASILTGCIYVINSVANYFQCHPLLCCMLKFVIYAHDSDYVHMLFRKLRSNAI